MTFLKILAEFFNSKLVKLGFLLTSGIFSFPNSFEPISFVDHSLFDSWEIFRFPGILRLKGNSSVDSLSSVWLFSFDSCYFLLHFLFYSFHSLFWSSVWKLLVIKSSGVVFDKINAKIAGSGKKCPVDVTGAYMISIPPFNHKPSITLPMFPRKLIITWNPLKRITNTICRGFAISKGFMYKGWPKVMHGVSILYFGSLLTECSVTRKILLCNLMHWDQQLEEVLCEIFLSMFQWLLIAYNQTRLVDGYGKNKQYAIISQDLTSKSFQEPMLNHSL